MLFNQLFRALPLYGGNVLAPTIKRLAMGKDKGKPEKPATMPTRLYEKHSKDLAELARLDNLDNVAEAFDKHFGHALDHLIIELKRKDLKEREEAAKKNPGG